MRKWLLVFIGITISLKAAAQVDEQASRAFMNRVIPGGRADAFIIESIPQQNGKDVFELAGRNGKIVLRGNNGLSVASALNYYLKNYCLVEIGWNTDVKIPANLPPVTGTIHKNTPYQYRYYLNYCTFNYSMSWWDWERWQKEIDWMALNGINMPLAITGEEAVWQDVYKEHGIQ
jgi:alpha-N-acetylglucosaminidase